MFLKVEWTEHFDIKKIFSCNKDEQLNNSTNNLGKKQFLPYIHRESVTAQKSTSQLLASYVWEPFDEPWNQNEYG